jgi:hypothetical protein
MIILRNLITTNLGKAYSDESKGELSMEIERPTEILKH